MITFQTNISSMKWKEIHMCILYLQVDIIWENDIYVAYCFSGNHVF